MEPSATQESTWQARTVCFRCDTPSAQEGWTFTTSGKDRGVLVFHPAEGWYPSKGDTFTSPPVACEPWKFYRLSFRSKAVEPCLWSVHFQDGGGDELVDDVYACVERSKDWVANIGVVRARESAVSLSIRFSANGSLAVRDVVLEEISRGAAAEWADGLEAGIPPVLYLPPEERLSRIPETMRRLYRGGTIRVVMLGDSIVNDTNNSNYDALLARHFPNSDLRIVASVRGSTGCWHYQEPGPFRSHVIDKKPDLLMIGGISHRGEIEPIRNVVRMAKAQLGCELMLMSGPVGVDWRKVDANGDPAPRQQAWPPDPFHEKLESLAREESIEYFDLGAAWHGYLGASGKPFGWFHRDAVHANDRGKQVLARLLEKYFARSTSGRGIDCESN